MKAALMVTALAMCGCARPAPTGMSLVGIDIVSIRAGLKAECDSVRAKQKAPTNAAHAQFCGVKP